jgi:ribosomal protein L29
MKHNNIYRWVLSLGLVLGLWAPLTCSLAAEAPLGPLGVVSDSALGPDDFDRLEELEISLTEAARTLRTQLRALRMQSGFNSSRLFKIERYMGKIQVDIQRMMRLSQGRSHIAMPFRILVDDLERQLDGLRQEYALLRQADGSGGSGGPAVNEELLKNLAQYIETVAQIPNIGRQDQQ